MTGLATSTPAPLAADTPDRDVKNRSDLLSGFGALLRLRFRLDRLRLAMWLAGIVGLGRLF